MLASIGAGIYVHPQIPDNPRCEYYRKIKGKQMLARGIR